MARDWEQVFGGWAQPPGQTEQDRCDNAERAIRDAVAASTDLANRNISVFAQGSYKNRTNVRADSDVDVCICCLESIFFDLPPNTTAADFNITTPARYSFDDFKNHVEVALVAKFGRANVARGKKAFDIHENRYRVSADAVPTFEYRRYHTDKSHLKGTSFIADTAGRIVNWPDQNYANGVAKNDRTGRRFKSVARILKYLRNEMKEEQIASAAGVSSFLLESLAWNVPDAGFGHDTLFADVQYAIAHLFNETIKDNTCSEWGEINELKYLFRDSQPWTRAGAHQFLQDAWTYIGLA